MVDSRAARLSVVGAVVACVLAACGGGGQTTVGGTVTGLAAGTAVTLRLNGDETLAVAANGSFEFSDKLNANKSYNVDVVSQPARANCVLANQTGTIDRNASRVNNVTVTCTQAFAVGGIVQGLTTGAGVVLVNTASTGVDSVTLASNGPFSFPQLVPTGGTFAITVNQQPTGHTCAVTAQQSGTVAAADVTGIVVTCT